MNLPVRARNYDNFVHVWPEKTAAENNDGTQFQTSYKSISTWGYSAHRPIPVKNTPQPMYEQLRGVIGCQQAAGQSTSSTEGEEVQYGQRAFKQDIRLNNRFPYYRQLLFDSYKKGNNAALHPEFIC